MNPKLIATAVIGSASGLLGGILAALLVQIAVPAEESGQRIQLLNTDSFDDHIVRFDTESGEFEFLMIDTDKDNPNGVVANWVKPNQIEDFADFWNIAVDLDTRVRALEKDDSE